MARLYLVEAK